MKYYGLSLSLSDMIDLKREDKQGIIKLLKDVKDRVSKGRTVAIFPEGTRNTENKFLPFKQGASMVANKHKLKVQPVVLVNSAKRFDTKNILASGGYVDVLFLPSFEATKERDWLGESREAMLKVFLEKVEE
jgi:1-acyl-sn-glycerol-3-phosphate acyltransferase